MLSSFQSNDYNRTQNMVPEKVENNFRIGQYSNTLHKDDSNFAIANRALYATIDKFERQARLDASSPSTQRRSFLENWHLHCMYSKSQQTLLGIVPVKPSVLLSDDDLMFTHPLIQEEEEEELYSDDDEEEDADYANQFYNLSRCPTSSQGGELSSTFETTAATTTTTTTTNEYFHRPIWIENHDETKRRINLNGFQSVSNFNLLSIQIPSQMNRAESLSSPEEESSLSDESITWSPHDCDCNSMASENVGAFFSKDHDFDSDVDDEDTSRQQQQPSYDLMDLYDVPFPVHEQIPVESVVPYQSLADRHLKQQQYGSMSDSSARNGNERITMKSILNSIIDTFVNYDNALENEELGRIRATDRCRTALNTIWTSLAVYVLYYWQLFMQFFTTGIRSIRFFTTTTHSEESDSLL